MSDPQPLPPDALRVRIDPDAVGFSTTDAAEPLTGVAAQRRAGAAIRFGMSVAGPGYNVFAMGAPGCGRRRMLREMMAERAAGATAFDDWVYVNNFEDMHRPRALRLPAGAAIPFRDAMRELIEDLTAALPAAFESEDYKNRRDALESEGRREQEALFEALRAQAKDADVEIIQTPGGFAFAPKRNGEIVKPEVFNAWADADRKRMQDRIEALQEELREILRHKVPAIEKRTRSGVRTLDRETAAVVVNVEISDVAERFPDVAPLQEHLKALSADMREHFRLFLALADAAGEGRVPLDPEQQPALRRYAVNVMDARHGGDRGRRDATAPIVEEADPTFANLIGRIEHQPREGALHTDFTMIRPGALHRANGGCLIVEARQILAAPFAWEALKRCLKTGEIRVSSVAEQVSLVSTVSLEPEPIPLSVKVALVGDRRLYHLLSALDPDFPRLFKVAADFDDDIDRDPGAVRTLARVAARIVQREGLRPFGADAVAAALEESGRAADDASKLSLCTDGLADLLREADHAAAGEGAETVAAPHVRQAVDARRDRLGRLRERSAEMIARDIVDIATEGAETGRINGLSVVALGEARFGRPTRITARTRMGSGRIVDIERESKLGGPLHSKGVMILSSFLAARFGRRAPVALSASIVFEQSYGGVDGDSASSAELYALLSSLSGAPIRQSLAVTGAVDQMGGVHAIGGVNEKIEGFFEICAARGLTGEQGVLIPRANVQHLNLRPEVVAAAEQGRFSILPVATVDEGIELLTGVPAGVPDAEGVYPPDTVNGRASATLRAFAEEMRRFAGRDAADEEEREEHGGT